MRYIYMCFSFVFRMRALCTLNGALPLKHAFNNILNLGYLAFCFTTHTINVCQRKTNIEKHKSFVFLWTQTLKNTITEFFFFFTKILEKVFRFFKTKAKPYSNLKQFFEHFDEYSNRIKKIEILIWTKKKCKYLFVSIQCEQVYYFMLDVNLWI